MAFSAFMNGRAECCQRAVFSSAGTVEHILVLRSLPDGLTEEAVRVAKQIKFTPATKDGKPISMIMELQYNFSFY